VERVSRPLHLDDSFLQRIPIIFLTCSGGSQEVRGAEPHHEYRSPDLGPTRRTWSTCPNAEDRPIGSDRRRSGSYSVPSASAWRERGGSWTPRDSTSSPQPHSSTERALQTQSGKPVSPTPSTGSDVMPEPSDRITNRPPAENTMYLPSRDHAGVYPRSCVSRVTPDPSGRIT
jgi:hypothetical protein